MWALCKVFIEFITTLLLFYVLVFWPQGMWDLSSLPRDGTCIPCIGRQSLNDWATREAPQVIFVSVNGSSLAPPPSSTALSPSEPPPIIPFIPYPKGSISGAPTVVLHLYCCNISHSPDSTEHSPPSCLNICKLRTGKDPAWPAMSPGISLHLQLNPPSLAWSASPLWSGLGCSSHLPTPLRYVALSHSVVSDSS